MRYVEQFDAPPLTSIPENVLVEQARAGDERAFEALVHLYHGPLLRYIQRLLNDDELAYDVLQQVFFQLYTSLAMLSTAVSPKGWLFRVAHSRCLDELRKKQRRPMVYFSALERSDSEEDPSPLEFIPDSQPLPEETAERLDLRCRLQRALSTLSPELRAIVYLHCCWELSFPEIGQLLEMPMTTVKTYFYRSLLRLRRAFLAQEQGDLLPLHLSASMYARRFVPDALLFSCERESTPAHDRYHCTGSIRE
jgi:RNA polymerase sigma-70 factor, ECF subfamily